MSKLKWYTEQELNSWLIKNKYSKKIANELAPMLLKNYNSAFKKGVECTLKGFITMIDEELPQINQEVLLFVFTKNQGILRAIGYRSDDKKDPQNINGWCMDLFIEGKVIAWSYLPKML